jgi:hypothetical protein
MKLTKRPIRAISLLLMATLVLGTAAEAAAQFPPTGRFVRGWAPENMSTDHVHTSQEAVTHARRFDIIVALRGSYKGHVAAMRRANRRLVLLVYLNGMYVDRQMGSAFPSRWYARNQWGSKIRSRGWGNYLMDPSRVGWRRYVARTCARFRSESQYDGCFLDMMGTATLSRGYLTSRPVNRRTGRVWTRCQWLRATSSISGRARRRIAPRTVVVNGLRNGREYFRRCSSGRLLRATDGGVAESWLRYAHASVRGYRPVSQWRKEVRMLGAAERRGKSVFALTKLWTSATSAQRQSWRRYAMTSFLLGTNGRSYFFFSTSPGEAPVGIALRRDLGIGWPTTRMFSSGGVFRRQFGNGLVLVNPSGRGRHVRLGSRLVKPGGGVISALRIPAHDGIVLTKP